MTATGWVLAVALAIAAGLLILWTTIPRRRSAHASTLEAVRDASGALVYRVAPLGLGCRGHVMVRRTRAGALERGLLRRLRGLEPIEVVELLRAEGLSAELMPRGGEPSDDGRFARVRPAGSVVAAYRGWNRRCARLNLPPWRSRLPVRARAERRSTRCSSPR